LPLPRRIEISTFCTPAPASLAVPHIPDEAQPPFQLAVVYAAAATGKVTVVFGGVAS